MSHDVDVEPYCYIEDGDPLATAAACRIAGVAFVNGVTAGWRKLDVVQWLEGAYGRAARVLPGVDRSANDNGRSVVERSLALDVSEERLHRLLADVRDQTLFALAGSSDGLAPFPAWALTAGSVIRFRNALGDSGWVPVDWPRMRLADRVLSLFACDALVRAEDYETSLSMCPRCSEVSFDPAVQARSGLCEVHAPSSVRRASGLRLIGLMAEAVAADQRTAATAARGW